MKIAIDASSAQGNARGMGVYTANLLMALGELRPRASITVVLDDSRPAPRFAGSIPFEIMKFGGPGGAFIWEQVYLPSRIRNFDLLHSPANGSPLFCPCPKIVTVHDAIFLRSLSEISARTYLRQIMGHFYRRSIYPPSIRRAGEVITVSEFSRKEISSKLRVPFDRIKVIPEALPAEFAAAAQEPAEAMRASLGIHKPYYLALGAYEKRKNIALLFEAISLMTEPDDRNTVLVLAGSENLAASGYESAVARMGVRDRVLFLPYVSEERLKSLYVGAEAFLWPTKKEGFGLPLLQAMSCSAPIIAADTECSRETADRGALFLSPDDPRAWAAAMRTIRADKTLRASLVEKGRARLKSFSWKSAAQATIEVYERFSAKS